MKPSNCLSWRMGLFIAGMLLWVGALTPWAVASDSPPATQSQTPTKSTFGSMKYTTTVERTTTGELSPEDFRQASTLGAQVLLHVENASNYLADDNKPQAQQELEHAQTLIGIIRDLLPRTTVTTIVTQADGKEVYRNTQATQDDQIPIFDNTVAVNVLQAIVDQNKEQAALQGIRLADAEVIHTAALVDLPYVERKITRALSLMNSEPKDAMAQLWFANGQGIHFVVNKQDDPLVKAQAAIALAEQMTRQGRHQAADENLRVAKFHLDTYRTLVGQDDHPKIKKLQDEIERMAGRTDQPGASEEIRGFWHRVTSWFKREPGQAYATSGTVRTERTAGNSNPAVGNGK